MNIVSVIVYTLLGFFTSCFGLALYNKSKDKGTSSSKFCISMAIMVFFGTIPMCALIFKNLSEDDLGPIVLGATAGYVFFNLLLQISIYSIYYDKKNELKDDRNSTGMTAITGVFMTYMIITLIVNIIYIKVNK